MMYRILNVRQTPGEDFKLWFTDDYWDLFVWVDSNKRISSFQLGFGKPNDERVLVWRRSGGLSAMSVNDGEDSLTANRSPLMSAGANFDPAEVLKKFKEDSTKLPKAVYDLVAAKLSSLQID